MRGRYSAATWLFAALGIGLLAVGARAPQPRLSPAAQAARVRLQDRARERAPLTEDASVSPQRGCLLDRSTGAVYRRNELGDWTAHPILREDAAPGVVVTITAACDAADPSARDYALAELAAALRAQWQDQVVDLNDSAASLVAAAEETSLADESEPITPIESKWSERFDSWRIAAVEVWGALAREWQTLKELVSNLMPQEQSPDPAPSVLLMPDPCDLVERQERSILVRSTLIGREDQLPAGLAEREEQSILLRR